MIFDLHCHTTHSDGALTPAELVARAAALGVDVLSITDHDTLGAWTEARRETATLPCAPRLVPGIEFSTHWEKMGIHVLGLNVDPGSDALATGVRLQTEARLERARRIGERLARQGLADAYAGAAALSPGGYLGRPQFARYLVASGAAASVEDAFKRYLGDDQLGDVRQHWAELPQVVEWIREAGGVAVLAHPLKYKLTGSKLKRLLAEFIRAGGEGLEVISGQQQLQQTASMARLCEQLGLLASCGSDFHEPGYPWSELGRFRALPAYLVPVWERF
ncbi:MAG: PHP domain-containing protein [Lysobacterales bacterium]